MAYEGGSNVSSTAVKYDAARGSVRNNSVLMAASAVNELEVLMNETLEICRNRPPFTVTV